MSYSAEQALDTPSAGTESRSGVVTPAATWVVVQALALIGPAYTVVARARSAAASQVTSPLVVTPSVDTTVVSWAEQLAPVRAAGAAWAAGAATAVKPSARHRASSERI